MLNSCVENITRVMKFKGYEVKSSYCWVDSKPVRMYFIENVPFTFDALEKEDEENKWVLAECAVNPEFTMDQIFKYSDYLIAEEMHPMLFEVPLVNPELLPDESV
jgi:hypothetical protein|tara:strand:+ start:80 stop:394 length:315 start_codon:yes stop_codon:yes gene_type:complete